MPAFLVPPSVHGVPLAPGPVIFPNGVPVAPGPAIFTDGASPPVPTATSSAVPKISDTPDSTFTPLPPVIGPGYTRIVDSGISRLTVPTCPSLQKRDAAAVAAIDGNPQALSQEDLSIEDNQSPLTPVGTEYSHDTFWHLEQPRIRFGYAKREERTDRFGNPPGWPIPFSVSFDEYVLKLDEPYAPPKPSLRGKEITTGGETVAAVAKNKKVKKVKKRGEEIIIVPDLGVPLEKGEGWGRRGKAAARKAVARKALEEERVAKKASKEAPKEEAWEEGLDEEHAARKAAARKALEEERVAKKASKEAPKEETPKQEDTPKEEAAEEETPKKEVTPSEEPPKEAPKEEPPKEAPKEETPKKEEEEEEQGHTLEPRGNGGYGNGDLNFSDHRLARKKKKGGSLEQEEQPLEYNFNVEVRLDNEEKPVWPFRDGFDDVAYHPNKGKMPFCVIL